MQRKRIYWLLALGAAAIVGAWTVRHTVLAHRRTRVPSTRDPKQAAAEQELVLLRQAVVAAPTDSAARWALVEFYNRYGLLDRAGAQIVVLLKLNPKDERAHLALASALFAKRRFVMAEDSYRDVIDMDPKSLEAWQGLSAALIKERRYLEANVVGQHAFNLNSKNPTSHLLLATSALEYADQFPDPTAHAGELEFARKELEVLKNVLPNNPDIYYALGRTYKSLHNRQGAKANLEYAHALQPTREDIGRLLADVYQANNDRASAQKVLEELTSHPKASASTYDLLGQIYRVEVQVDSVQKALRAFKTAAELMPKSSVFQEHLGTAYYQTGDMKSARSTFENVTHLDPNRPYAFQQLALIYTRLGLPKLAAVAARIAREQTFNDQQLTQIQELAKKHPENVNLHLLLAKRYGDLHMAGPSRDEYIAILKLDPKNLQVPRELRRAVQTGYIPLKQ